MIINFLLSMAILAAILIGFMIFVMYIHENKRGTKLWRFINKHIITDEDEYLKNK